jgi:ClpP class serine protease
MRNIRLISALTGILAMHPDRVQAYLPLLEKAIADPNGEDNVLDFTTAFSLPRDLMSSVHFISEFGEASPPEAAKPGDIAVIAFNNVITRHDYWYWSGVYTKHALLERALANTNIKGVILLFDSPGGEASAPDIIQATIRNATKPIHGYVDGLCASAAYEIAASCKSIYARSEFSEIGSIGTFTSLADWTGYYERIGVKLIEIYASASELKNVEVREAIKGNLEPLQKRIDQLNDLFIASIQEDRGDSIKDPDAYKGKIYSASEALKAGLIDAIRPFEHFVQLFKGTTSNTSKKLIIC